MLQRFQNIQISKEMARNQSCFLRKMMNIAILLRDRLLMKMANITKIQELLNTQELLSQENPFLN